MSARITIDVGHGPLEVTVRSVGACTCEAAGGVHDASCTLLQPQRVDLVIAHPRRPHRRPRWWHSERRTQ